MTSELSEQPNDPPGILEWLMYKSYAFQRDNAPDIEPNRWRKIYFNQELYEKIYQSKEKVDES